MSGQRQFSLLNIETQQTEVLSDRFVIRYISEGQKVSVRFEMHQGSPFIVFEGSSGFPLHNDMPVPPATPTRIKIGDIIKVGVRVYRLIELQSEADVVAAPSRDIWSAEFIRRRSMSRVEGLAAHNWSIRLGLVEFLRSVLADDKRLSIFLKFNFVAVLLSLFSLSLSKPPSNPVAMLSVFLWMVFSAGVVIGGFYFIWIKPPSWLRGRWTNILIFSLPIVPHLAISFLSLIAGSRALGFASFFVFFNSSITPLHSGLSAVRFPNDWYYQAYRSGHRSPASGNTIQSFQVTGRGAQEIAISTLTESLNTGFCGAPTLVASCFSGSRDRCVGSLKEKYLSCAKSLASQSWALQDLLAQVNDLQRCASQKVIQRRGTPPTCAVAFEQTINSQLIPKMVESRVIRAAIEESESRLYWCGKSGVLTKCSSMLHADCRTLAAPISKSCQESVFSSLTTPIISFDLDHIGHLLHTHRSCVLVSLSRSLDFTQVRAQCFVELAKGDGL